MLEKLKPALDDGKPARTVELDDDERKRIRSLNLLTLKPVMYVANVDEDGFEGNPLLDSVRELAEQEGAVVVPICAKIDQLLA